MSPTYPTPLMLVPRIAAASLLHRQRSFRQDARRAVQMIQPPLEYRGLENIPSAGPCLITTNHFSSPGFNAWWLTLSISSAFPVEIHWIMTGAMIYPGKFYETPMRILTTWAFARVAQVYAFTNMTPVPPYSNDTAGRARGVRHVLSYARRTPAPVVGMAPQGTDHAGGVLGPTPTGLGRFITHLSPLCQRILPVGIFEDAGHLCLQFGVPYTLEAQPAGLSSGEIDQRVSQVVMRAIARLLPPALRGAYA